MRGLCDKCGDSVLDDDLVYSNASPGPRHACCQTEARVLLAEAHGHLDEAERLLEGLRRAPRTTRARSR